MLERLKLILGPSRVKFASASLPTMSAIKKQFETFKIQFEKDISKENDISNLGINLEKYLTIQELDNIFQNINEGLSEDNIKQIKTFLIVKGRRLVSFPGENSIFNPLSTIANNLALIIFDAVKHTLSGQENEKCHYQLIYPHLQQLSDSITSEKLRDLPAYSFLVTDDGKSFFNVLDTLDYWRASDDYITPFRYVGEGAVELLTPNELLRLRSHSFEVNQYYSAIELLHAQKNAQTVANEMRILIKNLRDNGVRTPNRRTNTEPAQEVVQSTEYQVNPAVFSGIKTFKVF